ncbi:MAG: GNAT family N-acetyltransferase [Phycisphaerales bacterium]|nr:GNAT family N-acetyltransferase [Phycisphaerales bacterium]
MPSSPNSDTGLFVEHSVARLIETALLEQQARYMVATGGPEPAPGTGLLRIGSAQAGFRGVGHPSNRVTAFGMSEPVTPDQIDAAEAFFRERAEACRVDACPLADQSLFDLLRLRGYTLNSLTNVLVRTCPSPHEDLSSTDGVVVRRIGPESAEVFSQTLTKGFHGDQEPPPVYRGIAKLCFSIPEARPMLAEIDGRPVGGGTVEFIGEVACLYGAATIEAFRKRGVQTALLRHRLKLVRDEAATGSAIRVVMIQTRPGSESERNIVRAGFRLAYTRPQLVRTV